MADRAAGPPPTTRLKDLRAICHKLDDEMEKPEVVYTFSNGKKFESSDRSESGVYERS